MPNGTCNVCWEREWLPLVPTDEMIEMGAAEVRGALQQYYDGKIERIDPGSLAEDVLRAALGPSAFSGERQS